MTLSDDDGRLVVAHDYFGSRSPTILETTDTYYDAGENFAAEPGTECGWTHSLAEVVSSLSQAGLRIEYLHAHFESYFGMFPKQLVRNDHGLWSAPQGHPRLALTFSVLARRWTARQTDSGARRSRGGCAGEGCRRRAGRRARRDRGRCDRRLL
jgi:hypothetical protein